MLELTLAGIAIVCYILSMIFFKKAQVRRLWLFVFILTIIATFVSIAVMRFDKDGLLANATEMSELYFIYATVALLPAITLINLWMFRKVIWKVLRGQDIVLESNEEIAEHAKK